MLFRGFVLLAVLVCVLANAEPVVNEDLGGRRFFAEDSEWNRDISNDPVDARSSIYLSVNSPEMPLHPEFGNEWEGKPHGLPYVVVSSDQPRVPVDFTAYASESDPGPYPIPADAPIENGSDRHVLVIDRDQWVLYELFNASPVDGGKRWTAEAGAIWDLKTNSTRPAGWTSADAAGLPVLPGLVRYDEVRTRREITHALRFTVPRTCRGYVAPATHYAAWRSCEKYPPMGTRLRLRADYDLSEFPDDVKVILTALKKYGMILADNGGEWFLTGVPDTRWNDEELDTLKRVRGRDFEVLQMPSIVTE